MPVSKLRNLIFHSQYLINVICAYVYYLNLSANCLLSKCDFIRKKSVIYRTEKLQHAKRDLCNDFPFSKYCWIKFFLVLTMSQWILLLLSTYRTVNCTIQLPETAR